MIEHEGSGWRIAIDSSRNKFPVMIGGNSWAIELTKNEWSSLVPLVMDLEREHRNLVEQLMPQETLSLELERDPWWGCLEGDRESWNLQLILQGDGLEQRGFEAFWPIPTAQIVAKTMRIVWDSFND